MFVYQVAKVILKSSIVVTSGCPLIKRRITAGDSVQIHLMELRHVGNILIKSHTNDSVAWQIDCIAFINRLTACTGLIHSRKNMRECIVIEHWTQSMITKREWPAMILFYQNPPTHTMIIIIMIMIMKMHVQFRNRKPNDTLFYGWDVK